MEDAMTTKDEERGIATILGAMDNRSVMGVISDLLDMIVSGVNHMHHMEEEDPYLSGMVSGLLIAFDATVEGLDFEEGDRVDVHKMRVRGASLVSAATEMMRQQMREGS